MRTGTKTSEAVDASEAAAAGRPRVLILRAAGINCDLETEKGFRMAGAATAYVHVNALREEPRRLREFDVLAIPGGFSYGDDVAAGTILASELRFTLAPEIERFVSEGKLVLGICNGFQVLVKAGLLPGGIGKENGHDERRRRDRVTISMNDSGRFEDRWVTLRAPRGAKSVFLAEGEAIRVPVGNGEGKVVFSSAAVLAELEEKGQVALRYEGPDGKPAPFPFNPNGSQGDVAGLSDPTGRVMGLMPHPDRHLHRWNGPRWTREGLPAEGDGVRFFRNAVAAAARRPR